MAITTAVAATLAATTTVTTGVLNYEASQSAARASKNLSDQQSRELQDEQNARAEQAAAEAVSGQNFGFGGESSAKGFMTGFGFNSAPQVSANTGRGQITGFG